jgi:hypothetical protein
MRLDVVGGGGAGNRPGPTPEGVGVREGGARGGAAGVTAGKGGGRRSILFLVARVPCTRSQPLEAFSQQQQQAATCKSSSSSSSNATQLFQVPRFEIKNG